jgi:hypothetical protein
LNDARDDQRGSVENLITAESRSQTPIQLLKIIHIRGTMASTAFPWTKLKAETLRSVCRDLGAGATTRRNRDGMIAFLDLAVCSWENMKTDTLQCVCKDLGAASGARRTRDATVAFLEDVARQRVRKCVFSVSLIAATNQL